MTTVTTTDNFPKSLSHRMQWGQCTNFQFTNISLHAFFTSLFAPYLQHKHRTYRVYGGPQAPVVHKNAWCRQVLGSLRPFQFHTTASYTLTPASTSWTV